MGSGTIIRIIVGIILLVSPFILGIYVDPKWMVISWFISGLLIPLLFVMENACNCSGCILSNRCDKRKRFNFVKNLFIFAGFDKETINNIKLTYNVENTYKGMYHYIKDNYERIYNV